MEYHSGGSLPLLGRPRYCPGANANGAGGGGYLCETGHCCGESGCCTYYYELWWFWLLWTVLILFSCCCAYRHRRAKLRVQQQQRQRDISLLAYQGASSFPSSMLDLSFLASLKLPSYEEVAAQPSTPPPPYSSVFTAPRYPQPPRSAHPHLLSQHPGVPQHPGGPQHPGAPHRMLQALSDGPSSLSSDNSSSCSCDSCCPSSPCSSSLSAPVTYETDTSHASTPSEATPLALDPVAMETISVGAARLGSKDRSSVAILIEQSEALTVLAMETDAPSPQDAALPIGITAPIKQQLEITATTSSPAECSTDTRTLENTSFKPPRTLSLLLDSVGGNMDNNPSLVPISVSPQNPQRATLSDDSCSLKTEPNPLKTTPNTSPAQESARRTAHSPNKSPNFTDHSFPSQGIAHFSTKPAGQSSELTTGALDATKHSIETEYLQKSPSIISETARQAPVCPLEDYANQQDTFGQNKQPCELSKSSESVATNADQRNDEADTTALEDDHISVHLELAHSVQTSSQPSLAANPSTASTTSPILTPQSESPATVEKQGLYTCLAEVSIEMPDPSGVEPDVVSPSSQDDEREKSTSQENVFYAKIPPSMPETATKASSLDVLSPTFAREAENMSPTSLEVEQNSSKPQTVDSKLISLDQSSLNLTSDSHELTVKSLDARSFLPVMTSLQICAEIPPSMPQTTTKATLDLVSSTLDQETSINDVRVKRNSSKSQLTDSKLLNSDQFSTDLTLEQNEQTVNSVDSRSFVHVAASLQFYAEIPPSKPQTAANASSTDISPTFDQEIGNTSPTSQEVEQNTLKSDSSDSKLLNLDHSLSDFTLEKDEQTVNSQDTHSFLPVFHTEIPPSKPETAANASYPDVVSPTFDQETGNMSLSSREVEQNTLKSQPIDSKLRNLDHSSLEQHEQTVKDCSLDSHSLVPVMSSLQFYAEIPPSKPQTAAKASSLDLISPTLDQEMLNLSTKNVKDEQKSLKSQPVDSKLLNLDQSLSDLTLESAEQTVNSFFPAITIQADPPSYATSPSSIPSPSSPQTPPQSPPTAMLLLQPSEGGRSTGSSGHASSLSPSPRNTQSPPKQTLFSPCVDVFEPVDPTWDEEEAESDCEDSDVAADESQYRHRRLTGDSGIEVGRGRVEDEDEEEDEEEEEEEDVEKAKTRDAAESGAELHDSAERLRSCDITTF